MEDIFARTRLLIGDESIEKLNKAHVAIVGLGGVGSQLINLARCGVMHFDLFDNDVVSETNINRQQVAYLNTIGKAKVDVAKDIILSINDKCEVNTYKTFILPENINDFDFSKYDYVVDAIDTVTAKLALIQKCSELNVPIISCMGTGNKLDPTKLQITDINKTSVCPLAKVMRRELRARGIKKLKVLYSQEEAKKFVADSQNGRHAPGSMVFVPAVAGLLIANEIVKDIINEEKV